MTPGGGASHHNITYHPLPSRLATVDVPLNFLKKPLVSNENPGYDFSLPVMLGRKREINLRRELHASV
jgi:hypothetical protein